MTATDRLRGLVGSAPMKLACRVATTANITLEGLQTIDGVAVVQDDRVLVKAQTSAIDNGIYIADSGEWVRAPDFDGSRDIVKGTLVRVNEGSLAGKLYAVSTTNYEPVIGTDAIAFVTSGVDIAANVTFTPTGTIAATDVQGAVAEVDTDLTAFKALISAFALTYLNDADGAATRATLGVPAILGNNVLVYTANDTFEKATDLPAHVTHIHVALWAPGGGGGGADADGNFRAVAGSGGEFGYGCFAVSALAASETITLPAGGAGGTSANSPTAGTNASTASFGTHLTCIGGLGGTAGVSGAQSGLAGGTGGTGGSFHVAGGDSSIKENDTSGISLGGDGGFAAGTGARTNVVVAGRRPGGGGTSGNNSGPVNGAAGGGSLCIVWWH